MPVHGIAEFPAANLFGGKSPPRRAPLPVTPLFIIDHYQTLSGSALLACLIWRCRLACVSWCGEGTE